MDKEPEELTPDEHKARAMLMGMEYHHGNGFPIYIARDEDGTPDIGSMIDANTLQSIFGDEPELLEQAQKLVNVAKDKWK